MPRFKVRNVPVQKNPKQKCLEYFQRRISAYFTFSYKSNPDIWGWEEGWAETKHKSSAVWFNCQKALKVEEWAELERLQLQLQIPSLIYTTHLFCLIQPFHKQAGQLFLYLMLSLIPLQFRRYQWVLALRHQYSITDTGTNSEKEQHWTSKTLWKSPGFLTMSIFIAHTLECNRLAQLNHQL